MHYWVSFVNVTLILRSAGTMDSRWCVFLLAPALVRQLCVSIWLQDCSRYALNYREQCKDELEALEGAEGMTCSFNCMHLLWVRILVKILRKVARIVTRNMVGMNKRHKVMQAGCFLRYISSFYAMCLNQQRQGHICQYQLQDCSLQGHAALR